MDPLLWVVLATVVALVLSVAILLQRRRQPEKKPENAPVAAARGGGQPGQVAVIAGGVRRSRNIRSRIAAVQRARQSATSPNADDASGSDSEGGSGTTEEPEENAEKLFGGKKIGTKKLRNIQEKAERKAMREQEEAQRQDRKRRQALQDEERKKELENERIEKEKEEEEQRLLKEEQEHREQEEYEKLKQEFILEEEGEDADQEGEEQKGVREFIEYIKSRKVVYMEDLAAEFNMKTQDAISRVQTLQETGELTGVVDDRGKFIFISQEELQAVANFIKQRGRVSIAELVSSSNTLVNLQPDSTTTTISATS